MNSNRAAVGVATATHRSAHARRLRRFTTRASHVHRARATLEELRRLTALLAHGSLSPSRCADMTWMSYTLSSCTERGAGCRPPRPRTFSTIPSENRMPPGHPVQTMPWSGTTRCPHTHNSVASTCQNRLISTQRRCFSAKPNIRVLWIDRFRSSRNQNSTRTADKEDAQHAGAKWDPASKEWFLLSDRSLLTPL